jgi:uncharacterized membrane-anchored protein
MRTSILGVLCAPLLLAAATAWAQAPDIEAEQKAAFEEAERVKVVGPAEIALRDQAHLKLPPGYIFVPMPQAGQVMKAMGNRLDERLMGVVFPASDEAWFVAIKFIQEGYVRDDDAKDWNAEELLASLREGTAAANEERTRRGFPAIEVVGWAETPRYDAATHRLVWSVSSRETGANAAAEQGVNYNTYSLGREGYISLNLITDLAKLNQYRPAALQLLGALEYNGGKRYADFNRSTDQVAAYGLATLVAGAAAKKMGLFAVLLAFFAKFAKVIVVAGGAALWGMFKLFGRKKAEA